MFKTRKMLVFFAVICSIFFVCFYYIFCESGNNKDINQDKIADKVLKKFNKYEANLSVNIISNKNENVYEMTQVVGEDIVKMIINSPDNLKGIIIENNNGNLKVLNTVLNKEKIYDNYGILINNSLFLNTFAKDAIENRIWNGKKGWWNHN